MAIGYVGQAVNSILNSEKGFCKFLSANDTGATGGHQFGILISKSAVEMMFRRQELDLEDIPKKTVKIKCLRLEGSNFRLGGIAPITRAVPSFRVPMRLDISATWQKGN